MVEIVRLYQNDTDAQKAIDKLKGEGFAANKMTLLTPGQGGAADQRIDAEIQAGRMPAFYRDYAVEGLQQGRCVLVVDAPFGNGQTAEDIMDDAGPVDTERMPEWPVASARTTSAVFGITELSDRKLITMADTTSMQRIKYIFGSFFGMGLTSNKAAPLSDAANIPTVTPRPKEWTKSLGYDMLMNNPTPLSTAVNYKTVTERPKDWTTSFGMNLLASDRTPLSSFLNMPVLTQEQ